MTAIDNEELDTPVEHEIEKGDRVEWRNNKGQSQRGIVFDEHEGGFIVGADVPTGEPCPLLWGPFGIFVKVE